MKKLLAFTLSETLITLGIIGVIATLTLPNLTSRYKTKVYTTQMQKMYNQLSGAIIAFKTDNRVDNIDGTPIGESAEGAGQFLTNYFSVIEDCGTVDKTRCFASNYKTTANAAYAPDLSGYCVLTEFGSSICVNTMTNGVSEVTVDVNGRKAPNTKERDLFEFELYADGTLGGGDLATLIESGWDMAN